jgi:hypothetical protein
MGSKWALSKYCQVAWQSLRLQHALAAETQSESQTQVEV